MKVKALLTLMGVVLIGAIILHALHLDVLLWQNWKLNRQSMPAQGFNLGRYRVDIQALEIAGIDDDLSALTFNSATNSLFGVLNGRPLMVELSLDGELLREISIQGVVDMEGLTHVQNDLYVIAEERSQRLILARISADTQNLDVSDAPSLMIGLDQVGNKGFEGLSWDGQRQRLLVVKERDPLRLLAVEGFVDADPQRAMNISITEVKPAASPRLFMSDLSSLTLHDPTGHMLLLSDESHMVVEYDAQGSPLSLLGLWRGMSGLRASVPQAEGLAVDDQQRIYIVSEPNLFYRFVPGE
ncbi:SdiA-regulated domain-containing protein [Halopseudomonas pelagia]|uniref:SdiA-regulated domain-containing protein n=1 Tax=Halopseudomonas pelagia TaxID=553151 RepID=UPI0003A71FEB|nr:SdiA-regulated domain-containing protein [Halopseudomonas pelagia]